MKIKAGCGYIEMWTREHKISTCEEKKNKQVAYCLHQILSEFSLYLCVMLLWLCVAGFSQTVAEQQVGVMLLSFLFSVWI